jgi:hypothetical protein
VSEARLSSTTKLTKSILLVFALVFIKYAPRFSRHSFLSYGDMGIAESAQGTKDAIMAELKGSNYELTIHNGDISYACGSDDTWDNWFDMVDGYINEVSERALMKTWKTISTTKLTYSTIFARSLTSFMYPSTMSNQLSHVSSLPHA